MNKSVGAVNKPQHRRRSRHPPQSARTGSPGHTVTAHDTDPAHAAPRAPDRRRPPARGGSARVRRSTSPPTGTRSFSARWRTSPPRAGSCAGALRRAAALMAASRPKAKRPRWRTATIALVAAIATPANRRIRRRAAVSPQFRASVQSGIGAVVNAVVPGSVRPAGGAPARPSAPAARGRPRRRCRALPPRERSRRRRRHFPATCRRSRFPRRPSRPRRGPVQSPSPLGTTVPTLPPIGVPQAP